MCSREASESKEATRARILVVEDNPDGRRALEALLKLWKFDVRSAEDGEEGWLMALEELPQIAILDIGLPGLDGYELARRLRKTGNGSTRIIALTGYGRPRDRRRAMEAGFDEHLVKPVKPAKLREILLQG